MIVSCGSCQSKFKIDPARVPAGGTRVRCPKCKGVITVGPTAQAEPATPRPGGPHGEHAPLVVVAHGNAAFCDTLSAFLKRNHLACETAHDGESALALVREHRPAVLLVDVALPGIVGYALSERIKSDAATAGTRVVLIGAIYDRTRYRRPPASLYGSDGYIEKHEIPDKLVPLVRQLVSGEAAHARPAAPKPSPARAPAVGTPSSRAAAVPAAEAGAASPSPVGESMGGSPGSDQARRLARIIVSDIVLYNPDVVKKGIAEGNLADLLKDEIKEGRDLLKARVGAEAGLADYVLEALNDYVRRMKARTPAAAQR